MTLPPFLIYGANGYTGSLIAREAVARGHRPILAGRDAHALSFMAAELGVEHRVFSLKRPDEIARGLTEIPAVLNCAGPFVHTFRPLADACLSARVHYLDVTGEVDVFEGLAARDAEAIAAGVTLLPGVGFDVVPSDCLAAHLKRRLPKAERLALGIQVASGVSRGTATTVVENLHRPGLIRRNGVLVRVPLAWKTRIIDFGNSPVRAVTVPWGDVSTAYYSTAIPDVEVYMALSGGARTALRICRYLRWLFKVTPAQRLLRRIVRSRRDGPSPEERARGSSAVWGEAEDAEGRRAAARLQGPDPYTFTVRAALASLERLLTGDVLSGFLTPSNAFGPDFVLSLEGVTRTDEPEPALPVATA